VRSIHVEEAAQAALSQTNRKMLDVRRARIGLGMRCLPPSDAGVVMERAIIIPLMAVWGLSMILYGTFARRR
jgi:hypothetical protein